MYSIEELNKQKNKIINMDCLELLNNYPDNYFDLVCTDPPYGDNADYGRNGKHILNNGSPEINKLVLPHLYRTLKNDSTCYIFTNWKFCHLVRGWAEECGFSTRMMIVLVKNNIGMGQVFRNQHEICWVFEKGSPAYNGQISNVMRMPHIHHDDESHPHKKHPKIITDLISLSSLGISKNGIVLDCFSGSGTVAHVCDILKIDFVCTELDETYWKKSVDVFNKNKKKSKFF